MKIATYFHTVKYLKFEQIFFRLWYRFVRSRTKSVTATLRQADGDWVSCALYSQKLFVDGQARFLNLSVDITGADIWNNHEQTLLWLYNLHYFDDLMSEGAAQRQDFHVKLIKRWIVENPPAEGVGWQPYPLSLRIVNFVKGLQEGVTFDSDMVNSLATQAQCLSGKLERHILANHLFANGKALLFAGVALQSVESEKWLKISTNLLRRELQEQILEDGGNYELTPMYHCIMLIDLLDIINLDKRYPGVICNVLMDLVKTKSQAMQTWLDSMLHRDGGVSYFNDSVVGIAPDTQTLFRYADSINARNESTITHPKLTTLAASGYSRINMPQYYLIFDHGNVGPDYQPGHAHADTLSIEMGIGDERFIVNSGISEYGTGPDRQKQRSTASHSTVVVDDQNSSEVWGGFRVARRASVQLLQSDEGDNTVELAASHNGYLRLPGRVVHTRHIAAQETLINIVDELSGTFNKAVAHYFLHPNVTVLSIEQRRVSVKMPGGQLVVLDFTGEVSVEDSFWHPEFGKSVPNRVIKVNFPGDTLTANISVKDLH